MIALLIAGLGCALCALGLGIVMYRDYRREQRRPGYINDWRHYQ